ncbi:MAG: carboxypeptidase-like regulatory domain-containing protein [Mariniphaga sp.]|nr:carboxypeptidase-like regulatory domain-containing protein [Mariniphaga sp.]
MVQQSSVSGTVTDESGQPLPGVTVLVKGTTQGTVTNADGSYNISNVPDGAILQFSFVGMLTQEIEVGNQTEIHVTMTIDAIGIEEVVAIGYGIKKKSDVISSVISISAESLNDVPTIDIGEMLKGKAAGVFVTLGDAGPGGSSNILIRGKNSINGGNNPIVIADGVPVGSINDINPNDIESLEILKDAAAQAIYGARASNGVVLITTKRGKTGKAVVNYQGYYGAQTINRNFDVYNGEEFAQYKREAYRNSNGGEYLPDDQIFSDLELESMQTGKYINWEDEILRVAPIQNHNIPNPNRFSGKIFSNALEE